MDPVSIAGLAIGVASIGLQVYTGCIQGVQLVITALNFPEDCKYLNLRLRMEQQRLFAWSEASGLLDLDTLNREKILESNTFVLHRQTVLDLLVQIECLFKEFKEHQQRCKRLQTSPDQDQALQNPEKDAAEANFPLPKKRGDFIRKAMRSLKDTSHETAQRLRWVSFDKAAFELLLSRFSTLNDNMTGILDARMQSEIHHTVQDTNRGVLQLHHKITDLSRLVMALNIKLEASSVPISAQIPAIAKKRANADGLELLSQLAKFKAFNESIEVDRKKSWDEAAAKHLELGKPDEQSLVFDRSMIELDRAAEESDQPRCEAVLLQGGVQKKVWVEWKEYDRQRPDDLSPPKDVIVERVRKLAALLNHTPQPEDFRTPHCLGFFDRASSNGQEDEEDMFNMRLGLVFERPADDSLHPTLPPVSLHELLETTRKPPVTKRVKLAHAISKCLLYLHAVNWLHKGLRSHNIIFFRTVNGEVEYGKPILSGFDFSRPARADEMTDIPGPDDDVEFNLYRHPSAQSANPDERERFKKSFDIYSLGVLLVEIAHWKTLDKILDINLNVARGRPSVALRVRDSLLTEDQIADVGGYMGELYQAATKVCIAGGQELGLSEKDDQTNDFVAARLSMALHEGVVKRLGEIQV